MEAAQSNPQGLEEDVHLFKQQVFTMLPLSEDPLSAKPWSDSGESSA